jgi:hypothetical protein
MSTPIQILFAGIFVAIAAILLAGLTDMSIGVVAIFVLAGVVFFAFVRSDASRRH